MNAIWGHSVGAMILVLMLCFIGIWIWAWLPFHKGDFDKLARIPMCDDEVSASDDEGGLR